MYSSSEFGQTKSRDLRRSRFRADALRFENNVRFGQPDQAMQISTRDAQAAGCKGLVAVVIAYSVDGEFHFVVAEQMFECALRIVFADVDDLVRVHFQREVFRTDRQPWSKNNGPLNGVL